MDFLALMQSGSHLNHLVLHQPMRYLLSDLTLRDILTFPISAHYVLWKDCLNIGDGRHT